MNGSDRVEYRLTHRTLPIRVLMAQQAKKQKQTVSGIPNSHDSAFKSALSDVRVAREFFETYLPTPIRSIVDLSDLRIQGTSFTDEELTTSASDICGCFYPSGADESFCKGGRENYEYCTAI